MGNLIGPLPVHEWFEGTRGPGGTPLYWSCRNCPAQAHEPLPDAVCSQTFRIPYGDRENWL